MAQIEQDFAAAWEAFSRAARAAAEAGYVVSLPQSIAGNPALSATAKALPAAEVAPVVEPVAEPFEAAFDAVDAVTEADPGDESPKKKRRFFGE